MRAAAIRSGRAYVEFRDLPNPEVEAIKKQLGDKVMVQQTPVSALWGIWVSNTRKPFTDVRLRKALTLGIDHATMSRVLYPINGLKLIGGFQSPCSSCAPARSCAFEPCPWPAQRLPEPPKPCSKPPPSPSERSSAPESLLGPPASPGRLLDVVGAAKYLAVSVWTIRDLVSAGRLARVRLPLDGDKECRRLLLDARDLDRLIDSAKDRE